MKTKLLLLTLLTCFIIGFYSCSDDDNTSRKTNVTLSITNPGDMENLVTGKWVVTFTERNTGSAYNVETDNNTLSITVPEGDYVIQGKCPITYTSMGKTIEWELLISSNPTAVIIGEAISISMVSSRKSEYTGKDGGFLIQEIYYTGTATPEGKQYTGDTYIKLYNNTDKTLYADGLFLAVTQRTTSITYTYTPEVIDEYVPVSSMIIIPGDGTKYPVESGKSFILTGSAINHKEGNSNSFNLSYANMEWRNDHLTNQPANNPAVPDADLICGGFLLHVNGLSSIIMGRLDNTSEKFLTDYTYEYTWKTVINGVEYERGPFIDYKVPNNWVMDAVYTSIEGKALTTVFSPTIDMGWTYCGAYFGDKERFGKSVIRKVLSTTSDGRQILQDTNNSAVDFTPNSTPSLSK